MRGTKIKKQCLCCKKPISVRVSDHERGWGKYCSKSCKATHQEQRTGQFKAFLASGGDSYDSVDLGWDAHKSGDER